MKLRAESTMLQGVFTLSLISTCPSTDLEAESPRSVGSIEVVSPEWSLAIGMGRPRRPGDADPPVPITPLQAGSPHLPPLAPLLLWGSVLNPGCHSLGGSKKILFLQMKNI